jgi:hypothetical protein
MTAVTARLAGACQVFLLLLAPSALAAQMRASERAAVSQTIDGTVITIDYARPQVRGRDSVFGKVVRWDDVWTPGANFATTLEVNRPLKIDGHPVAPGKYSLWLVVRPGDWTMVIDPRAHMYHVPFPDSTADQIRWAVKPGTGPFTEMLLFTFRDVHGDEGTLVLQWGTTQLTFHLEVEPKHKLTIAEADARPYLGRYRFRWASGPDSTAASTTTLAYENGMLIGHWTPAPWPEIATFVLVKISDDWFMVGTMENGKLTDLMDEWTFQFTRKDGVATKYEAWSDQEHPDATATRE